jgi:hypothetical protein
MIARFYPNADNSPALQIFYPFGYSNGRAKCEEVERVMPSEEGDIGAVREPM